MTSAREPVRTMQQLISLDYTQRTNPLASRFGQELVRGRIIGHRCPECGRVYSPPRGFCPLCVVETTGVDEVEVSDRGTLTQFTIVSPVQYYGQNERESYVQASILLDGADTPIGGQRLPGIPHDELRMGMRLQAVWRPEGERKLSGGDRAWGGSGIDGAVSHFEPTGEPDASPERYKGYAI